MLRYATTRVRLSRQCADGTHLIGRHSPFVHSNTLDESRHLFIQRVDLTGGVRIVDDHDCSLSLMGPGDPCITVRRRLEGFTSINRL